jgi:hypothetical protein
MRVKAIKKDLEKIVGIESTEFKSLKRDLINTNFDRWVKDAILMTTDIDAIAVFSIGGCFMKDGKRNVEYEEVEQIFKQNGLDFWKIINEYHAKFTRDIKHQGVVVIETVGLDPPKSSALEVTPISNSDSINEDTSTEDMLCLKCKQPYLKYWVRTNGNVIVNHKDCKQCHLGIGESEVFLSMIEGKRLSNTDPQENQRLWEGAVYVG